MEVINDDVISRIPTNTHSLAVEKRERTRKINLSHKSFYLHENFSKLCCKFVLTFRKSQKSKFALRTHGLLPQSSRCGRSVDHDLSGIPKKGSRCKRSLPTRKIFWYEAKLFEGKKEGKDWSKGEGVKVKWRRGEGVRWSEVKKKKEGMLAVKYIVLLSLCLFACSASAQVFNYANWAFEGSIPSISFSNTFFSSFFLIFTYLY